MTDAYRMLVLRLADLEPRSGYQEASQLPELSRSNVEAIIDEEPSIVDDALADPDLPKLVRLNLTLADQFYRCEGVALAVTAAIESACRTHIYHDVADECASRTIQATGMDYSDDYTDLPEEPWVEVEP
jgi:hypothetical protein